MGRTRQPAGVAALPWNQWQLSRGMGGRLRLESVATLVWNTQQTGQIVAIGRWVLHQACMDMAQRWRQTGQAVSIAVNISPLQFRRPEFIEDVFAVLETSGLPPELLELEVTEGVLLSGIDKAISMLKSLRDLGVQVAIDDFGTGFSSLSYLRQLPITKVKLDRSFVNYS